MQRQIKEEEGQRRRDKGGRESRGKEERADGCPGQGEGTQGGAVRALLSQFFAAARFGVGSQRAG